MPDYGLPLEFGTFITPSNADPEAPVALAQFSESVGFDLVTFQDHPYQPAFLDTWTLMTWVAARTSTIHISPNVLNLPLRPPAVTARAAASLDLLSGGRFDLGLGAGGFWDAIEAMGGRRLTPGQAVDALSEGIDVIRGVWATDDRSPLRIAGELYRLDGAKRGPASAHPIPLWIGAYKPRMLRLTGRKGDGWLPSLAYLKPGDLEAGNATIDEAATGAGRDPREIRRLANIGGRFAASNGGFLVGPPGQWVDELLPHVLEHGIATFILAGDDPTAMQAFAEEVAPALREAVARERGGAGEAVRSVAALSARRDGIDYEGVPTSLASRAVEPGDFAYRTVRSTYMRGGAPGLVLRPENTAEVVDAVAFARSQTVPLGIRSGGHGISGRSTNDGGIVIDLGAIDAVEVLDESARLVRIGAGARWMDVAAALEPHGWALSSGDYGGVGVGGLATAGGIGWLVREHGLTIDHLRAVELVTADGRAVRASDTENAELFWAVRGAGANFGIVTQFEFQVDEVGEVGWAQLAFDASDWPALIEAWGAAVEASPRDVTSFILTGAPRRGQQAVAQLMAMVDSNDPDTILERLQPFARIAPLLDQSVTITTYAAVMANAQGGHHDGRGEPNMRSGLIEHVTHEFAEASGRLLESGEVFFFQLRSAGGAVSDVAPDATAYAHRSANFSVAAVGSRAEQLDREWEGLADHFTGMYLSFDTRVGLAAEAFPEQTLARLRAIKREWDPTNLFRDNFSIETGVTG
jgi:alkanesulfonate monooxygenase SsuD/methylene tetrahydromethanopterin reductase-like flavin-dependent oxidoreductase (luciferase family)/FAD/FMN-containing dehydrogenase